MSAPELDPLSLPTGAMVEALRRSADFQVHELSGARVRATMTLNEEHHQVAEPIFQGRTQQLRQVSSVRLDDGKLVARGQLRLQNLPLPAEPAT